MFGVIEVHRMREEDLKKIVPAGAGGASPATGYQCAAERLRQAGYRVTSQRAQLLQLLVAGRQEGIHLDAEGLYAQAQEAGLDISLATVYRALAVFQELGLVSRHHFAHDGEREYYEASTNPSHHHFTCLGCGQVIEFQVPGVQSLVQDVATQLGVTLRQSSLYLVGYCSDCQDRMSHQGN